MVQAAEVVDDARRTFTDLYLEEEFEEVLSAVEEALSLMDEAEDVADRVKRNALLWIYLTEWMATTATAMFCGVLLWILMVRRRLYREVGVTQLR